MPIFWGSAPEKIIQEDNPMTQKPYPTDVLAQAQSVLEAWKQIDPALKFGDLTTNALSAEIDQAAPIESQIANLEAQLTSLRNQRDSLYQSIWDKVKRTRAAIKGIYGDDSSQYEMVGGTRMSERKPRTRKPAAA